ncbi:MAG: hypothetical protein LBB50_05165 [Oscillospiraceae bacterium]|jgi:hypothetical protein|nr:hypothetical protein [Oscillospiraceae bacterium]
MKKSIAIILAALLLAALAFGCGPKTNEVAGRQTGGKTASTTASAIETTSATPPSSTDSFALTTTEAPVSLSQTPAIPVATVPPETIISYVYVTTPQGKTKVSAASVTVPTKAPVPSTPAATQKPATKTSTTKKSTTTTKYYANPITIGSNDEALRAFNSAVSGVINQKVGFNKSYKVTYKDWNFDPSLTNLENWGIPANMDALIRMYVGDPDTYLSTQLNAMLGKGVQAATAHKGDSTNLIKASTWGMGDLKSVSYAGAKGSDWTVTLNVNDGNTRQEKKFLSSGISGNSPIDKGPLNVATDVGAIVYDHMSAERVFGMVKSQLSFISADPIDISEATSQVKFTAKFDGEGKFISITASYNQVITIKEIKILNGSTSYKDNTGSATVTVTYDSFDY